MPIPCPSKRLSPHNFPATLFNIAGPEILSVRAVCEEFAAVMKKPVTFTGEESADALLSNAQLSHFRISSATPAWQSNK